MISKPKEILELEKMYGITLNEIALSENIMDYEKHSCYQLSSNKEIIGLNLSNNQISEIKGLEQLTQLQKLELSRNRITEIRNLEQLMLLQELELSTNQIAEIKGLENLTQLNKLRLSYNRIAEIKGLERLKLLQILSLNRNQIIEIKGLEQLTELGLLSLVGNQITDINNLEQNSKMFYLNLSNNKIKEIKGLENLTELRYLDLENNQIGSIEPLEDVIESFKELKIYGNRFSNPQLKEEDNLQDVKMYFQTLEKSDYPVTLPAKVMFLGNHESGKTSFLHFFQENKLNTKTTSTEILSIHQYFEKTPKKAPDTLPDAMIYDFGGQDYYHGLYRAFFSEDSINVLMWCNFLDKNQIRGNTRDFTRSFWLHQLPYYSKMRKSANEEPIILVQTHADDTDEKKKNYIQNRFNGDKTFIDINGHEKQLNIIDEFFVALKNQEDTKDNFNLQTLNYLRSRLLHEIDKKRIEEKKPAYYKKFLKKVLNTKEKEYTDINKLLVKDQTLEELKYELNQMHLRGLVMYYRDTMPDIVWTNPTATVRYIHDDILFKVENGTVKKKDFETNICPDEKIRELLIDEKIIFYDESNNKDIQYIIPMKLSLSKDDNNFEIINFDFSKPNFILKFKNFLPFGLINNLICLFGVHSDDKKQFWRDQLIFTFNREYKVWIRLDFSHLEIAVHIHKKDGIKTPFLSLSKLEKLIFINIIDLYNCKKVEYYWDKNNELCINNEYYEWPAEFGELNIMQYAKIKNYIQRREIDTPEDLYISIDEKHFLQHWTIEYLKENQNTVIVYPIDNEKKIDKKNQKTYPIAYYKQFTNNEKVKKMGKKIFISYSRKDVEYKDELKKHLNMLKMFDIADNWSCEDIGIEKWHDKIQKELQESDLIIYMLSVNFFSSNYILENEVREGMKQISAGKNKNVLCVIVSDFVGLDKLKDFLKDKLISDTQEAITKLSEWQYLPYWKTENKVTGNLEEKIIPLKRYPHIEKAYAQITEKVLELM